MRIIFTFIFIATFSLSFACSGFPKSFCQTHAMRPSDAVIKGSIIAVGSQSIQLKVLEVLHGSESRSVVTIWDGADFDCNGNISMKAAMMGSVSDTLLAILPIIGTVNNAWDVAGDYSRPLWLHCEPVLKIKGDTIRGLINGSFFPSTMYWTLLKMKYTEFKSYWTQHQADCSQMVGITELDKHEQPQILQKGSLVEVYVPGGTDHYLKLVSVQGQVLAEEQVSQALTLDMSNYAPGMYVLWVSNKKGAAYRRKLLR